MDGYIIRRVGTAQSPQPVSAGAARRALADRMASLMEPKFQVRYPPKDLTWGPERTQPEALDLMFKNTQAFGAKAQVRGFKDNDPSFALIHVFTSLGSEVVKVALEQLGDEYTWASEGPNAFDCSGLVLFCYQKVGVNFAEHSADFIMKAPQVHRFSDRSKVRDGDLIGYNTGRLPRGDYDHIGIACRKQGELWVIDASSSADQVVFRPADSNPIVDFGYVYDVTGPH